MEIESPLSAVVKAIAILVETKEAEVEVDMIKAQISGDQE